MAMGMKNMGARALRPALLGGVAVCVVASGAWAQSNLNDGAPLRLRSDYFGYGLQLSPSVSYSDNINLLPEPFDQGSFVASTTASGSGIYAGRRFTGIVSGDLNLAYIENQNDVVINQDVSGLGTFTAVDNLAYIDVAASSTRQLLGDNARFSQNINAARTERVNVNSFSVSPYLYREFEDDSEAQLRYRFSRVFVGDQDNGNNQLFLNDSQSQELQATWQSGRRFEKLTVGLTAYGVRTEEDGSNLIDPTTNQSLADFTFEQGTLSSDLEYAFSRRFSLIGAVGYDQIRTNAPDVFIPQDELSGVFWRAGFRARPGRRTDIRLAYGRRFGDDFIDADISYDLSRRFSVFAAANRSFTTRAQQVNTQINAEGLRALELVDQLRDGAVVSADSIIDRATRFNRGINAQTIGLAVSNNVSAGLRAVSESTSVQLSGNYSDQNFGFREIETLSAQLAVNHRLSRRLSAYGDAFFRHADTSASLDDCIAAPSLFGINPLAPDFSAIDSCNQFLALQGRSNTVGGRVGLSYQVVGNMSAFGEYAYTNRFSPIAPLEFEENVISAGLTFRF